MSYGLDTASVYTDFQGLAKMRKEAHDRSPEALRKVAQQFEALFVHSMLKSMRDASIGSDLFDSDQMKFYRGMFDQQIALSMSEGKGLGLADMLVRQLSHDASPGGPERLSVTTQGPARTEGAPAADEDSAAIDSPAAFVQTLEPLARDAARELGVSHKVLLAQAALETGWGRAVLARPDGSSSHNLFNIKADGRWSGDRVQATTLEYEAGVAVKRRESFRAYGSYAESFADYVDFLRTSPRYRAALDNAGDMGEFVRNLHSAGYATDPDYAGKINRIVNSELLADGDTALKETGAAPIT